MLSASELSASSEKRILQLVNNLRVTSLISLQPRTAKLFLETIAASAATSKQLYEQLTHTVESLHHLTHEVEWVLDNFYIIEGALVDLELGIVKKEFIRLPLSSLEGSILKPRIYLILSALLKETDGKLDRDILRLFLAAYQRKAPLSLREFNEMPTILKVILVERMNRIIEQIAQSLNEFEQAQHWALLIKSASESKHEAAISDIITRLANSYPIVSPNFAATLLQHFSLSSSKIRPVIKWLRLNLLKQGISIKNLAVIETERRSQQSEQITNIINALRWLNQVRWNALVDEANALDSILNADPSEHYAQLDSKSRLLYRRAIARIADESGIHEAEIAKEAIALALKAPKNIEEQRHVGYYLISYGKETLERSIGYTPRLGIQLLRFFKRTAGMWYFGGLFSLTILLSLPLMSLLPVSKGGALALWLLILLASSDIAVAAVNTLVTNVVPARALPKIDFDKGIPERHATFVAIPALLRSKSGNKELARKLEVNFLANNDTHIYFALLMGLRDAPEATLPDDEDLIRSLQEEISNLNRKYATVRHPRFFMLFQRRTFNPREGVFMEYERKRGKLREFNQLLLGKRDTRYVLTDEEYRAIPKTRYVITLDEDTQLPRDAASQMIGAMAHPLNCPRLDISGTRVRQGYGIIQPRVAIPLTSAQRSTFAKAFSSGAGIDPYANVIADVYQDVFDNAIFFGKGIYDVAVVEATMADHIPENLILSHDLLEGLYARTALATDIQIFDGFPARYHEYILRLHRWIRGDWQIARWLLPFIQHPRLRKVRNRFSFVDRWKIFDNLRRSVVPIGTLALLLTSWLLRWPHALLWSLFALLTLSAPFLIPALAPLFRSERHLSLAEKIRKTTVDISFSLLQGILRSFFLLHQGLVALDAISRTLLRLLITKKHLLQWRSASDVGERLRGRIWELYQTMGASALLALLAIWYLLLERVAAFIPYLFLAGWFFAPLVAYVLSQVATTEPAFSNRKKRLLRKVAVKTIRFFLEFSNKEHHWLIPDHFQTEPRVSGHPLTSPTNLGAMLISLFSARDFGYLGIETLKERLHHSLASIKNLERFKGHLFNWYNVEQGSATSPKYVSTVDSANFLTCVLTVSRGLELLLKEPVISKKVAEGASDILSVIQDECAATLRLSSQTKPIKRAIRRIAARAKEARARIEKNTKKSASELFSLTLSVLSDAVGHIRAIASEHSLPEMSEEMNNVLFWIEHLETVLSDHQKTAHGLLSYLPILEQMPEIYIGQAPASLLSTLMRVKNHLKMIPSLEDLAANRLSSFIQSEHLVSAINTGNLTRQDTDALIRWLSQLERGVRACEHSAATLFDEYRRLIRDCNHLFKAADFRFLYNEERGLFHIGYNATFNKIDNAFYDFFASEANLASYIAIIKGHAPQKHWFYLGRKSLRTSSGISLISWGGSLFEYLTSLLFLRVHPESVLGKSAITAVSAHRRFGRNERIPWGVGESAFGLLDLNQNYQYQIFGAPELGLKRGLADYLVVAPYTTALSLLIAPNAAVANLRRLMLEGGWETYGFYDALDYTSASGIRLKKPVVAKIHYAHHQGFLVAALNNAVHAGRIQKLFHSHPLAASGELLLEEKMPTTVPRRPLLSSTAPAGLAEAETMDLGPDMRQYIPAKTPIPRYALLSNGSYHVGISNGGGGFSSFQDIYLTRFRPDPLVERFGFYLYLKNEGEKTLWSATELPTLAPAKKRATIFAENRVEFEQRRGSIKSHLTISVDPNQNLEIRTLTLSNEGLKPQTITATSFGEVSLASAGQDLHHSAFQKLMVKAEVVPTHHALLFSRPHPNDRKQKLFFAHALITSTNAKKIPTALLSRDEFLGRHATLAQPQAFAREKLAAATPVFPLDPIFSLQKTVTIPPGESATFVFLNTVGFNRDSVLKLLKRYHHSRSLLRISPASANHLLLKKAAIPVQRGLLFQELASRLLAGPLGKQGKGENSHTLTEGHPLWKFGVSGVLPILLIRIHDIEDLGFVKQALQCRRYLHAKGLSFDMVILNEQPSSYLKTLHDEVDFLIRAYQNGDAELRGTGRVYHLKADLMPKEEGIAFSQAASVILDSHEGPFEEQIRLRSRALSLPPELPITSKPAPHKTTTAQQLPTSLVAANDLGGFDPKNNEYALLLKEGSETPAPWAHMVSSDQFGFIATESGESSTWAFDSYDNRLTSWFYDPLNPAGGEVFYVRDEETGAYWSPTPAPARARASYLIRFGRGYASYALTHQGLEQELLMTIAADDPLKVCRLKIKNVSARSRQISVFSYLEPVLGVHRQHTNNNLLIKKDALTHMVLVQNLFRNHFQHDVLALDFCSGNCTSTNDREEFIGRSGSLALPAALSRTHLSDSIRPSVDSCVAMQTSTVLLPNETKEFTLLMGYGSTLEQVQKIVLRYRSKKQLESSSRLVAQRWASELDTVKIKTPDPAFDLLVNNHLLYQTLSSRLRARTGFYQPSGAYGFRDQLQDSLALLLSNPSLTRSMLLNAAHHQFKEGDVLNWWHGHNNFGSRTIFTDHQAWLPYVALQYLAATGDETILNEPIPFLDAPLPHFEDFPEWTGIPAVSTETSSFYEHCIRAIDRTMQFGPHHLPLIGKNDWNDGLSNAGVRGKGESVWLGWLLYSILKGFAPLSEKRHDPNNASRFLKIATELQESLEKNAWDGEWYKRAYLDSGTPLGSSRNEEYQIDSIVQSWAVLSGGAPPDHATKALASAWRYLLDPNENLIKLISPPLSSTILDPGYLKDYPPGVRENGSQYNHATLWLAQAFALQGDGTKAKYLLDLANPVLRTNNAKELERYRAEPFAVASDIYALPSYSGRAGWSWYTGSAGLFYRVAVESILGLSLEAKALRLHPCLPNDWKEAAIFFKHPNGDSYAITILNPHGASTGIEKVVLDSKHLALNKIPLQNDGKLHTIEITLGQKQSTQ